MTTIKPPTTNRNRSFLQSSVNEVVKKIESLERQRIDGRGIISDKESDDLRLQILDLQDEYCRLMDELTGKGNS